MSYLKSFQAITDEIVRANGTPLIVTAEAEEHPEATRSKTGYTGEALADPENRLAKELKSRNLVDVAISQRNGYPHGMAQPAILVIKKDGTPLFSWAINPSAVSLSLAPNSYSILIFEKMNLGGAKDRVDLDEVWQDLQGLLRGDISKPRENYSKQSILRLLKKLVFG